MKLPLSQCYFIVLSVALACGSGAGVNPSVSLFGSAPETTQIDSGLAELGKMLFFDNRISAGADVRCSQCHIPEKGWSDGLALGDGYPGTSYFRNTKSLLNTALATSFYWDGRFADKDLAEHNRDAITAGHFMAADERIVTQRLRQIPDYVKRFNAVAGGEPTFPRILQALSEFQRLLTSRNVPFDRYAQGDLGAISSEAKRGLTLFLGKAKCATCHRGHGFSDGHAHRLGVPEATEIFDDFVRHTTFRAMLSSLSTPGFVEMRADPGHFVVTQEEHDRGSFLTPTLREVSRTAPYMHNGAFATLQEVVEFYDRGGGPNATALEPLGLSDKEKSALVAFLESLSGDEILLHISQDELPPYKYFERWYTTPN